MLHLKPLFLPCLALALLGCAGTTEALLATEVPTRAALPPSALALELTGANTTVEADVSAVASYTIRFEGVKGKARFAADGFEGAEVTVDIDAQSATASLGMVADIARSDQFLDVANHPTGRFVARNVRRTADEAEAYTMWGDLTLHGHTRTVQVPMTVERADCVVAARSEFGINRRDFAIESDGSLDGVVSDTVVIRIAFRYRAAGCVPTTND